MMRFERLDKGKVLRICIASTAECGYLIMSFLIQASNSSLLISRLPLMLLALHQSLLRAARDLIVDRLSRSRRWHFKMIDYNTTLRQCPWRTSAIFAVSVRPSCHLFAGGAWSYIKRILAYCNSVSGKCMPGQALSCGHKLLMLAEAARCDRIIYLPRALCNSVVFTEWCCHSGCYVNEYLTNSYHCWNLAYLRGPFW